MNKLNLFDILFKVYFISIKDVIFEYGCPQRIVFHNIMLHISGADSWQFIRKRYRFG